MIWRDDLVRGKVPWFLASLCLLYSQTRLVNTHFFGSFFPESPLLLLEPPLLPAVRAGTEVEAAVVVAVELAVVVRVGNNWEVVGSDGVGFVAEDVGWDEETGVAVEGWAWEDGREGGTEGGTDWVGGIGAWTGLEDCVLPDRIPMNMYIILLYTRILRLDYPKDDPQYWV